MKIVFTQQCSRGGQREQIGSTFIFQGLYDNFTFKPVDHVKGLLQK